MSRINRQRCKSHASTFASMSPLVPSPRLIFNAEHKCRNSSQDSSRKSRPCANSTHFEIRRDPPGLHGV